MTYIPGPIQGEVDDFDTTEAAEGDQANVRITPERALHANLRAQDGTEIGTESNPLAVSGDVTASGTVSVDNFPGSQAVTGPLTDAELRASAVPVSGTVSVDNFPGSQAVTGPLTDTELRASPVPVSGTFYPATQPVSGTVAVSNFPGSQAVTGPLTDAQLRATPVPVSGTVTATGPLTDTQLRATAVPISGTVTATGPLTDTQLRATAVPVSGTVTATGPLTDTQLRATAVPVSGTVTATGPLTDTQLRASAVPVSGTVTANAGTNLNTSALALDATLTGGTARAKITDGTNNAAVKAASTAAVATDPALVVVVSPNNVVTVTPIDGQRNTYTATAQLSNFASMQDVFVISGSGTKTIRILRVEINGATTGTNAFTPLLIKRSAANSGGTTAAVTAIPHDSSAPGATAGVVTYSANASSLGTAVGTVYQARMWTGGGTSGYTTLVRTFAQGSGDSALVLRGTAQSLAVNFNGIGTFTTSTLAATVTWTEE